MKNSRSNKSGNGKIYKIFKEFSGSVPAMFNFVQDSTNELERQLLKKQPVKWIVKNTCIFSLAGAGILSALLVSCEKEEGITSVSSPLNRQEKAAGYRTSHSVMIAVDAPGELIIIQESQVWRFDKLVAAISDFEWNDCATLQCRQQAENDAIAARCEYWNMTGHPYWTLINKGNTGSANVTVNTLIASETFILGGPYKGKGKYSFTMSNPDGTSRLTNLTYSVNGSPPVAIGHTVVDGNSAGNNCFLDLNYSANSGPYGNPSVFSYLKTGQTIGAIFASDDFPGNDAGCPGISVAVVDPVTLTLGPGNHTIVISGNLKGSHGLESIPISQVKTFTISSTGCEL